MMKWIQKLLIANRGEIVEIGQKLLMMESMKMESGLFASTPGKILKIFVEKGQLIAAFLAGLATQVWKNQEEIEKTRKQDSLPTHHETRKV